jgi:hypothetical protein
MLIQNIKTNVKIKVKIKVELVCFMWLLVFTEVYDVIGQNANALPPCLQERACCLLSMQK